MKLWLIGVALISLPISAVANQTDYLLPTCIKPKTEPSFDYVECLNKKGVARVGNLIQTPFGEFPYPLGLINKDGNIIVANEYHRIYFPQDWEWDNPLSMSDALILVIKRDLSQNPMFGNLGVHELYGLVNPQGEFIVPLAQYDYISSFYDSGLTSVAKDGKYGFIDSRGKVAIPLIYDYAYNFDDGFASVKYQGRYGVIDTLNNTVIDFNYQNTKTLNNLTGDIYFAIKSNDKYALFNQQLKQLTDFSYDMIDAISFSELFIVGNQDKYGMIDNTSKLIIPIQFDYIYDSLTYIDDDYDKPRSHIKARQGDKYLYFDTQGNLVFSN